MQLHIESLAGPQDYCVCSSVFLGGEGDERIDFLLTDNCDPILENPTYHAKFGSSIFDGS